MADMLASVADLRNLLDNQTLATVPATAAIEVATELVQGVTGRIVLVEDEAFSLLGTINRWFEFALGPVTAVESVELDGEPLTVVDDYLFVSGRLWRACGWQALPGWPSTVSGVYTHGYAPGDPNLGLAKSVTLMLAATIMDNPRFVKSERIADYSVAYQVGQDTLGSPDGALQVALRQKYGGPGVGYLKQQGDLV